MIGILGRLAGLAVALVLLAIVFGIFERFWPAIRGHHLIRRKGFKTDVAWFAFTPIVGRVIVAVGVALAILPLVLVARVSLDKASIQAFINRDTWMTAQPAWFQVVAILVAGRRAVLLAAPRLPRPAHALALPRRAPLVRRPRLALSRPRPPLQRDRHARRAGLRADRAGLQPGVRRRLRAGPHVLRDLPARERLLELSAR